MKSIIAKLCLSSLLLVSGGHATIKYWDGSTSGSWSLDANWSSSTGTATTAPTTNDTIRFVATGGIPGGVVIANRANSNDIASLTVKRLEILDAGYTLGSLSSITVTDTLVAIYGAGTSTVNLAFGGGSILKDGIGTLIMGSTTRTNTGNTRIKRGIVEFNVPDALGPAGTVFLGDVSGSDSAVIRLTDGGVNFSRPIVLVPGSTGKRIMAKSLTTSSVYGGGVTGAADLYIQHNATTGTLTVDTVNVAGNVINEGTGFGAVTLRAFKSNVKRITLRNGAGANLNVSGTLGDSLVLENTSTNRTISLQSLAGTGDLILENNNTFTSAFSIVGLSFAGRVINRGTSTGTVSYNAGVTGPSSVIQASATSFFDVTSTTPSTSVFRNTAGAKLIVNGFSGTGDLNLENNTNLDSAIVLSGGVGNSGRVLTAGTGTGSITFRPTLSGVVTEIVQASKGRLLMMTAIGAFTGKMRVKAGSVEGFALNSLGASGTTFFLGDTGSADSATLFISQSADLTRPLQINPGSGKRILAFNGSAASTTFTGLTSGSGNLVLKNNGSAPSAALTLPSPGHAGTVTSAGTSTGLTTVSSPGAGLRIALDASSAGTLTLTTPTVVDSLILENRHASTVFTVTGIAGSGTLVLERNGVADLSATTLGFTGSVLNRGTGLEDLTFSAPSGIAQLIQGSTTSRFILASLTVGAGGTTARNTTGKTFALASVGGTGVLTLESNSSVDSSILVGSVSGTVSVVNAGTGTGTVRLEGASAVGVTVSQNSATSRLLMRGTNAFAGGFYVRKGITEGSTNAAFGTGTIYLGDSASANNAEIWVAGNASVDRPVVLRPGTGRRLIGQNSALLGGTVGYTGGITGTGTLTTRNATKLVRLVVSPLSITGNVRDSSRGQTDLEYLGSGVKRVTQVTDTISVLYVFNPTVSDTLIMEQASATGRMNSNHAFGAGVIVLENNTSGNDSLSLMTTSNFTGKVVNRGTGSRPTNLTNTGAIAEAIQSSATSGFVIKSLRTGTGGTTLRNTAGGVLQMTTTESFNGTVTLDNASSVDSAIVIGALNFNGDLINAGSGTGSSLVFGTISGNTRLIQNSATSPMVVRSTTNSNTQNTLIRKGFIVAAHANALGGGTMVVGDVASTDSAGLFLRAVTFVRPITISTGTGKRILGSIPGAVAAASVFTAAVSGTNNLYVRTNGSDSTRFQSPVDINGGSLIVDGSGNGYTKLDTLKKATAVTLNSANSTLVIGVLDSGTVTNNSQNASINASWTGGGRLTLNNGSSSGITVTGLNTVTDNPGRIRNIGAGNGTVSLIGTMGSGLNIVQKSSTSLLDIVNLALATPGLTLTDSLGLVTVSGSTTGTGSLTVNNATSTDNAISVGGTFNPTGGLINAGTGSGAVLGSANIGTNVTEVKQNSLSSLLVLWGTSTWTGGLKIPRGSVSIQSTGLAAGAGSIFLGDTTGSDSAAIYVTTLTVARPVVLVSGTTGKLILGSYIAGSWSGGVTGTQDLRLRNQSSNIFPIGGTALSFNPTGKVINDGIGSGSVQINGSLVGPNVTELVQSSATGNFNIITQPMPIGNGKILRNTSPSQVLNVLGISTGSGDLTLRNDSSVVNGISFSGGSIDLTGRLINTGSGSGSVFVGSSIGSSTSGVIQKSPTSTLNLFGGHSLTSSVQVRVGTVIGQSASNVFGMAGTVISLGDTTGSDSAAIFSNSSSVGRPITLIAGSTGKRIVGGMGSTPSFSAQVSGSTDVTIRNNTTSGFSLADSVKTSGRVFFDGTSSALTNLTRGVAGAREVVQNSATAAVSIKLRAPDSGTTITNNSSLAKITVALIDSGKITLDNKTILADGITVTDAKGTVTNVGNGSGSVLVTSTGALTQVQQNSATSTVNIGSLIVASSGTTVVKNSTAAVNFSGGTTGTGGLTLANNSSTPGIDFSTVTLNHIGYVHNSGAGTGAVTLVGLDSNVTEVVQKSSTSPISITQMVSGSVDKRVANDSGATVSVTNTSGTGNVLLENKTSLNGAIQITGTTGNTGRVTNAGSGTGSVSLGAIGAAVTNIVQYSPTSPLSLTSLTNSGSAGVSVRKGALTAVAATSFGSGTIRLGDSTGTDSAKVTLPSQAVSNAVVLQTGSTGNLILELTGATPSLTGGITGTNNFVLRHQGTGTASITTNPVNITGRFSNAGTGSGTVSVSGGVGSGTSVLQNSLTSPLTFNGTNTTFTNELRVARGIVNGNGVATLGSTGNLVLGDSVGTDSAAVYGTSTLTTDRPIVIVPGTGTRILGTKATGITATFQGGVTGSGDLTVVNTNASGVTAFQTQPVNNSGKLTIVATALNSATNITGGVGTKVREIILDGTSGSLSITTTPITVRDSGTILRNNTTQAFSLSSGTTGTGNITLANGGVDFTGSTFNHTGVISLTSNSNAVLPTVGANVTRVEHIGDGILGVTNLTVGASGKTLRNTSSSATAEFNVANTTGSGDVTLENNGLGLDVRLSGSINHTGRVVNAGNGPGIALVTGLGSNVTDLIQNSLGSELRSGGTNAHAGSVIRKGTFTDISGTSLGSGSVFVGDTVGADSARLAFRLPALGTVTVASPIVLRSGTTGKLIVEATSSNFSTLNLTGGVTGNNDLILRNQSSETVTFTSANSVNNGGTVFFADGVARAFPVQSFGSNVRKIHKLWGGRLDVGSIAIGDSGTTVVNAGGFPLAFNSTSGTGSLTLQAHGSAGIEVFGSVNHAGLLTNSGTAGSVSVIATLGSNITGVLQNSTGSSLHLAVNNNYAGPTTIQAGTLTINGAGGLGDASATNKLVFAGGTLNVNSDISSPSSRALVLQDTAFINVSGGIGTPPVLTFAGSVSGPGGIVKTSGGTLSFTGGNALDSIGGDIRIQQGMLTLDRTIRLKGNLTNNGVFTQTSGRLTFSGGALQKIRGTNATTVKTIGIANDSGVRIERSTNITDSLVFVNGKLFADSIKVTLGSAAIITGATTGRFVEGNLEKHFSGSNPTFNFAVGKGGSYRPVTLALLGSSLSGSLTASTNLTDTTGLGSSGFTSGNDVSGSWTLTPTGLSGFTTYDVTPTWATSDLDGGATPLSYTIRKLEGGSWLAPTTLDRTTNSARATGLTSFGTLRAGQILPPAKPTALAGVRSDSSVILTWTAPADTGGSRLLSYTATSNPGGFTCVSNTGTPVVPGCTVTGLTNGTAYKFTVIAANDGGNSAVSDTSAAVIPSSLASKPLNVTAIPQDGKSLLSWSVPLQNGGVALDSFKVTAQPGGAACLVSGTDTSCTVLGLTNGTAYRFTVKALNAAGESPASDTSIAVTPLQAPSALSYAVSTFGRNVTATASPTVTGGSTAVKYTLLSGSLPTGLSLDSTSGVLSGKPTTAGVYTPTLRVRNVGGLKDTALTFTVNGFQYTTASATYGKNSAISANAVTGVTGTGGTYSASPALPLGFILNSSSGTISGSSRVPAASAKYAITRSFTGASAVDTISFTVNGFSYLGHTATYTQYAAITANTVDSIVGAGGSYAITPTVSAGLSFNTATGAITGTPTTSNPLTKYAITRDFTNASASDTISFSVNTAAPASLSYTSNTIVYGKNWVIDSNKTTVGTATDSLVYSISAGALPTGLSLNDTTGAITGMPKQNGIFTPTVRVTNGAGYAERTLNITVNGFTYGGYYYTSYGKNFSITPKTLTSVTGTGGTYSVTPALPTGLVLDSTTGTLSGTPKQQVNGIWYTLSRNFSGATATDSIVIEVRGFTSNVASVLRQHATVPTHNLSPVVGFISEYSISPGLPEGTYFNAANGRILGAPSKVQTPTRYVITGTDFGSPPARDTITLSVVLAGPSALAYTLDTATYGRNFAITANTPVVGTATDSLKFRLSSGTLPSGLSLDSLTGAISGKPAQAGVFTPTIRVSNDSGFTEKTLNLTVNGFAYASPVATYGKYQAIPANAVSGVTGTGGAYSVSPALPTGLSLNTTTGEIAGIPAAQNAAEKYTVTRNFTGSSATDTVAFTVNGFTYATVLVTAVQHAAITADSARSIIGAGGSYSVSPALPAGLSLNTTTGTITGTPTVTQSAIRYAITRNFTGASATDSVSFSVSLAAPTSLSYASDTAIYGKNVSITANTATVGTATDGLVFTLSSGSLPTGLSLNASTGALSGKPTQSGVFAPVIRVANDSGFTEKTLNLTVNGFSYTSTTSVYGKNQVISANTVSAFTGAGGSYSINPALPLGLILDINTGAINGLPKTQTASAKYVVSRTFTGATAFDTLSISVNGFRYVAAASVYAQHASITSNTVDSILGSGGSYSVSPALPNGLALDVSTGTISGTPTVVQSATKYAVTRNFSNASATDTVSITVFQAAPSALAYTVESATYGKNAIISANTPTVGTATDNLAFTLESGALPTGLSLNATTGAITGKATQSGTFTPKIRVSNDSGFSEKTLNITVNGFAYASPIATYGKNRIVTANLVSGVTGTGGAYSITPALPSGLSLNASTGEITGLPVSQKTSSKYVVSRDFIGATASDTLTFTVNGFTYGSASVSARQYAVLDTNRADSVVGASGSYSVSPTLPTGLLINAGTGAITGTPTTVQPFAKYAVTRDFAGASATDTVSIAVRLAGPTSLAYALDTATYSRNVSILANTATVAGATDGLTFTLASGALPTGLSLNASTGAITGKPTIAGVFAPKIRVANDSGAVEKQLDFTVNGFTYSFADATYGKNQAVTPNTVSAFTGTGGSYSVSPALPAGLILDNSTGAISGKPSISQSSGKYAVTRNFTSASVTDSITITVNGFGYATPTANYVQHAAITSNTVTGVIGTGGAYSIVPSLPSGLVFDTSTGAIAGTPTAVQSAAKYAVTRNFTGASATDTLSISVGLAAPSSLTYTQESPIYAKNVAIATNTATVGTATDGLSFSLLSGALPAGLSLNTSTGAITGTPTVSGIFVPTIRTSNGQGNSDKALTVQVNGFTYASNSVVYGKNIAISPNTVTGISGVGGTYSVSPALPTGLVLNTSTGAITGLPASQKASSKYVVSRNFTGATAADTLTLTVNGFTFVSGSVSARQYTTLDTIRVDSLVGTSGSYSVSPTLPTGLSLDAATGKISGTPTVVQAFAKYAVTRDFSGASATDTVSIAVRLAGPASLAYALETATYARNVSILANTATVTGATDGLTYTLASGALPTGLSLNPATGAITGKPSVAGDFAPKIRVANDSGFVEKLLNLTVNGFTYSSTNVTFGKNYAIIPNTVSAFTGTGGTYSVSPVLPTGLVLDASTGAISGTPTVASPLGKYAITRNFTGASVTDSIIISVNGFGYATASANYIQHTAITSNTISGVTGTDGSYSVTPALPTGLSLDAATGAITGTPTAVQSAAKYAVTRNFTGASATDTLSISVILASPSSLAFAQESPIYAKNVAIATNTATVGTATEGLSFSVLSGALPSGLSLNASTGAITGTPTVSGVFTPTIRASNGQGNSDKSLTIQVNGFTYASGSTVYGKNTSISSNTVNGITGSGGSYTVSPALPTGLVLNSTTGAITGLPVSQKPSSKYVVSRNFTGATAADTLTLTVNGFTFASGSVSARQYLAIDTNRVDSVIGVSGSYSVSPSLPSGLSLDAATGKIAGTPTLVQAFVKYAVTRDFAGASATDTVSIAVRLAGPVSLAYSGETAIYARNVSILANTATVTGATDGLTFTLSSGALPAGLSLNASTGAITGKPTVAGIYTPKIRVANDSGFVEKQLAFTVNGFTYTSTSVTYGINNTIAPNTVSAFTGTGGAYSVSPALPTGLMLDLSTGAISGTPTIPLPFGKYAITRNFTGASVTDSIAITVNGFGYATASANYIQHAAITSNTISGVTGSGGSYSVTPPLPTGLSLDVSTGAITGTPTAVQSAAKYAVTRNFTGASATDTLSISVILASPSSLSYAQESPIYAKNVAIGTNTATVGTATDGLSFSVLSGALPAGLLLNASTGTITGTPTISGVFTPVIRASNGTGNSDKSLILQVNGFAYTKTSAVYGKNTAVSANTVSGFTGSGGAYTVSPALPAGLILSASTGEISGKPTSSVDAMKYVVMRDFTGATATDTLVITVNGFAYSTPSAVYVQNAAILANTVSGLIGSGGTYSIEPALPTGLLFNAGTGEISGTPTVIQTTTKYSVTRNFANASASDTLSIAVGLVGPSSLAYSNETPVYGKNTVINANAATVGTATDGLGFSVVSGTLPAGISLNTTTGALTGKPTATGVYSATIRVANGAGSQDRALSFTINGFSYPIRDTSYAKGTVIASHTPSSFIGAGGAYSVLPALPEGLSLDTTTGAITGTPSAVKAATKYAITRTYIGATASDTISLSVFLASPSALHYTVENPVYAKGTLIAVNSPIVTGGNQDLVFTLQSGALPAGLLLNASTGTISGTPLVFGVFTPTIRVANAEGQAERTFTITVNGFTYGSATVTYGKNVPISPNEISALTGTGGSFGISPALPAGLALNASTGAIIGKPTIPTALAKYVVTRDFTGAVATDTVSIVVNGFVYNTLVSTYPQNLVISPNSVLSGVIGIGGGYSVSPALPVGLSLDASTGMISGTPTIVQSAAKYTVTRDYTGSSAVDTLSIAIGLSAPSSLAYTLEAPVYGKNSVIASNGATVGTATDGLAFSIIAGSLPGGVSLNTTTGTLTGKPTVAGSYTPTLRVANSAGSADKILSITVNGFSYSVKDTAYAKGVTIAPQSPNGVTGVGGTYSVSPALPDGITLDAATGAITGIPTVVKTTTKYAITRSFSGASASDTISLSVFLAAPSTLQYTAENPVYAKGTLITANVPSLTGGNQDLVFAVQTGALPAGLLLNANTGAITGTPTTAGNFSAVIRATNASGFADRALSITVPGFTYATHVAVLTKGIAMVANDPQNVFGTGGTYGIEPALSAGLSLDATTGRISGTPSQIRGVTRYTITRAFTGATVIDSLILTVNDVAPATLVFSTPAAAYNFNEVITPLTATATGGTENLAYTLSSGTLPAGLSLNGSTGSITGTPTALGTFALTIRVSNSGGFVETSLTLNIRTAVLVVTIPQDSVRYAVNQPSAGVVPTATGGVILSWSISPDLAAATGLVFNTTTGTISGTPTIASSATQYVVTAIGHGDARGRDTLVVTTFHIAPTVTYLDTTLNWNVDVDALPFSKTASTGLVTRYSIAPAVPAGVLFDTTTGRFSGKPTVPTPVTGYIVTVHGPGGTGADTVRLAALAVAPKLILATDSVRVILGTVVSPVSATNTGGRITGWSISLGSNGLSLTANTGLVFDSLTGTVSGTASIVSVMVTYTLRANGLGGTRDSIVVRVAVDPGSAIRAYAFRVTGRSGQYALRMPALGGNVTNLTVEISAVSGRKVWSRRVDVKKERLATGTLLWDGRDQHGTNVAAGMYIVRVGISDGGGTIFTREKLALDR